MYEEERFKTYRMNNKGEKRFTLGTSCLVKCVCVCVCVCVCEREREREDDIYSDCINQYAICHYQSIPFISVEITFC